uniref:Uncharacterized protein n=1 Tax=Lutzomyia longipalpis TaxID=7200 RepID=A0A7G3B5I6_LUTLO
MECIGGICCSSKGCWEPCKGTIQCSCSCWESCPGSPTLNCDTSQSCRCFWPLNTNQSSWCCHGTFFRQTNIWDCWCFLRLHPSRSIIDLNLAPLNHSAVKTFACSLRIATISECYKTESLASALIENNLNIEDCSELPEHSS